MDGMGVMLVAAGPARNRYDSICKDNLILVCVVCSKDTVCT